MNGTQAGGINAEQEFLSHEIKAVVERFNQTIEQMLQQVESELLQRADDALNTRERQLLTDAYINLRKKRTELQSRFEQILRKLISENKEQQQNGVLQLDQINLSDLQLVDTAQVDEDVQISNFAGKIKSATEAELRDLNARLNFLHGEEGIDDLHNPLRPEHFCRALSQACETLETDHQSRIQIMRAFEKSLSAKLSDTYRDLNQRLIAHNVLPTIKFSSISKKSAMPPRRQPLSENAAANTAGGANAQNLPQNPLEAFEAAVENTITMFEALQNMVARSSRFQEGNIANNPQNSYSRRNLFNAIQELNQSELLQEEINPSPIINFGQFDPNAAPKNHIWQHREQLAAAAPNHLDRVTIDVVAMLFDEILADDKVPLNIKNLISRLQLPVLKIALADSNFFATRTHPARRLIDRIASCAIGYSQEHDTDDRFYKMIMYIVNTVIKESSTNPEIFAALFEEFETFLAKEQQADNHIVNRAADILEQAEIREVVGINATIQIRQLLETTQLNDFLSNFMLEVWSQVLAEATCRTTDPHNDPLIKKIKSLCIDLIWSAQTKTTQEDKKKLVQMLPSMITTLREGFALISYPADKATQFFSQLMQLHSNAVKTSTNEESTTAPTTDIDAFAEALEKMVLHQDLPQIQPGTLIVDTGAAERLIKHEQVAVSMVTTKQDPPANIHIDKNTLDNWVDSLERGNWLLLRENNEWQKIRLAWVSPLKTFYLFSSQDNHQGHSMTTEILRQSFACGKLRFAEDELLVDRAVRAMMTNLAQPAQSN